MAMNKIRVISDTEYKKELRGEAVAALIGLGFLTYIAFKFIPELL